MKGWRRNYLPTLNVRAVKQRRLYGEAIDAVRASVGAPRELWDRFKEASASRESHRSTMTGVPGDGVYGRPEEAAAGVGEWGRRARVKGTPLGC